MSPATIETTASLKIEGMTCAGCAARVQKALAAAPGVTSASVNFATETATIEGEHLDTAHLTGAVEAAGYHAHPADAHSHMDHDTGAADGREIAILVGAALLTLPLVVQMFAAWADIPFSLSAGTQLALALPVQAIAGWRFYRGAWNELSHGGAGMDTLVAMGTTAAFAYSLAITAEVGFGAHLHLYYEAAAVIVTLVRFGRFLEGRAKRSTTAAIRALMNLRPETAHVIEGDKVTDRPVSDIAAGAHVLVRPGERVPVDGVVLDGASELDEALVTGESMPVEKREGDKVTGGTINGSGLLTVEATAVGADAVVARMAALVEKAQTMRPPMQLFADRVAGIFVPVVIAIALVTFGAWLVFDGSLDGAVGAAVAVLVVACPCALGLATPAAIAAGTGAAARAGILIRDSEALERANGLARLFFDKTGTLTRGEPAVTDFLTVDDAGRAEVLHLAATAQTGSEHPLAKAVRAFASDEGVAAGRPEDFRRIAGRGLEARVEGRDVLIGSPALMAERQIDTSALTGEAERLAAAMRTVTFIAVDGKLAGLAAIADPVREGAPDAVAALAAMGIEPVLLTGDAQPIAEAVAKRIGIARVRAGVRPEEKADAIAAARDAGPVAMVGDGVNDAPALAAADLGIAMSGGSDAALETAAITLMRPEPRLVPAAIRVAAATRTKVRQNLFWAFAYNVALIPVAALGWLNPAVAGAAMALSSLSVLGNSLLLTRWRPNFEKEAA